MYFVNYMYCGILFLSILVNTDIGTKSSIQFLSQRNNIFKELENILSTTQYEDNVPTLFIWRKSMEINQISFQSHRQVKLLSN